MIIVEIILVILGLSALVVVIRNPREILIGIPGGILTIMWRRLVDALFWFFVFPLMLLFFLIHNVCKLKVYKADFWKKLTPKGRDVFADFRDFED